jgi:anthranilate synthase component 1
MTIATDIHADLITPLGAYLRLRAQGGASFLLESVEKGRLGRYSLIGSGTRVVSFEDAERELAAGQPVVGYLGYDHIAKLEPTVQLPDDGPDLPESRFVVADSLVRFDHAASVAEVLSGDSEAIAGLLGQPFAEPTVTRAQAGETVRYLTGDAYEHGVRAAKDFIRAGDAYQIVLSQRAERRTDVSGLALYRALRRINPSPYHFLLELGDVSLVGSSPETLVKLEGGRASVNPIAGTTEPGAGDAEQLLASEKDKAEHVMLVDLGRNDLSRVCRPGTVRVGRFLEPERYSHVTHLVSEATGELKERCGPFDLLRACFPAGTVSGAPKVRAMQIISELEGYRRGPYAGAIGYALPGAAFDTCIAIRMVVLTDGLARLQAGAGIVADSDPRSEHEECLRKLAALELALEEAERFAGSSDVAGKGGEAAARRTAQTSADKRPGRSIPPPAASGDGRAGLRPAADVAGEESA